MPEDVPLGILVRDLEHREFAEKLLKEHPPGSLLLNAERAADQYFKVDKAKWLLMFQHDYVLAVLKGDDAAQTALKTAYGKLAEALDWGERAAWRDIESGITEYAEGAANILFSYYSDRIRVEGWRVRVEEGILEGLSRGIENEPSAIGDRFRTEYGRWLFLLELLEPFESQIRLSDRVALWMAGMLEVRVRKHLYGKALHFCYLDYVLNEILTGERMDYWADTALWYAYLATKRYEEHLRLKDLGSLDVEDLMVYSAMAASHIEPGGGINEAMGFLTELNKKFREFDLPQLYRTAKFGPEIAPSPFYSGVMEEPEMMTKEEREFFSRQREASDNFHKAMCGVVSNLLGTKLYVSIY